MCVLGALFGKPKIPTPIATPSTPQVDDDAIRQRQLEEQAKLQGQGSAGTIKTDLTASDVRGKKRVLLGV
jgi:hypothetical protein